MAGNATNPTHHAITWTVADDVSEYHDWCDQLLALHLDDPSLDLIDRLRLRILEQHTRRVNVDRSDRRLHEMHGILLKSLARLADAARELDMA